MKRLTAWMAVILMVICSAFAEDAVTCMDGIFEYRLTDGGAELIWTDLGDHLPSSLVVPDTLGGFPLIGIAGPAFSTFEYDWDDYLQYIVIPEGVRYFENAPFTCCHHAAVLILPSTLEIIPEGSFYHFGGEIILHPDNPFFTNEYGFLVDLHHDVLLYASPSANEYDLPAVRRYGACSLENWRAEDGIAIIPEGVEEIGAAAFAGSEHIAVSLPETLKKIEQLGLYCDVSEPVVLPEGCTDVAEDALLPPEHAPRNTD